MLHMMPYETCMARLVIVSCNPFSPWQSAVFTCFFLSLFLSQQLQSAANLRQKRPVQAPAPHPARSQLSTPAIFRLCRHWSFFFWRFKAASTKLQKERPGTLLYSTAPGNTNVSLLLAHGESALGLAPTLSSPLHEIGILTLSRLNFGRRR